MLQLIIRLACAGAVLASATPASAQLAGGGLGVGGGLGGALGGVTRPLPLDRPLAEDAPLARTRGRLPPLAGDLVAAAGGVGGAALTSVRRLAAQRLLAQHGDLVEADEAGAPVVRGRILAIAPTQQALAAAQRAGYRVAGREVSPDLQLELVTLTAPHGLAAPEALRRLRAEDPAGQYDLDHIYQESATGAAGPPVAMSLRSGPAVRVGLVDGSAAAGHPAFRGVRLTQKAFAPGGASVTDHGTATASLLAGSDGRFHGGAPGAAVLVADVYGPTAAGGSAQAIVRGLAWLAQSKVGVVNISLVGPPNLALAAAVRGLVERGVLLVAAVGNDGPAAPPLYPAAYPGVVAVTGVDARRQVLPEAGQGAYVAFAAPGAQLAAAVARGGYVGVRGTSFAAPLVAAALARRLPAADPSGARLALQALEAEAQDLGAPGRDPVYGFGLVSFEARVDPAPLTPRR